MFLSVDIRFAETLAELDYRSIHNEGHGGILGLGLIEERQSAPANSRVNLWEAQSPNPQNTDSQSALTRWEQVHLWHNKLRIRSFQCFPELLHMNH